jgi:universal stress protein A
MKILLTVDDSECSREAVKQASAYFNPQTTQIKILHVTAPPYYSTPPQMARGYAPEMEAIEKNVGAEMEHFAEMLRSAGFAVDCAVETGEVRSIIIDFAGNWGADLIVIGSRGYKGLTRLLLGSVAESVVRHAHCSVLVVREPAVKRAS